MSISTHIYFHIYLFILISFYIYGFIKIKMKYSILRRFLRKTQILKEHNFKIPYGFDFEPNIIFICWNTSNNLDIIIAAKFNESTNLGPFNARFDMCISCKESSLNETALQYDLITQIKSFAPLTGSKIETLL